MLDETLLKSNFLGRDGFVWWIGRVADPGVWKKQNIAMDQKESMGKRCKVRIIGYHPFDANELAENDLPWAQVIMDPVTGGGNGGMGDTLTLVGGETCLGFFLDGEEAQQPVIFGLLDRHSGVKNSIDPGEVKRGSSQNKVFTGGNNDKPTKSKNVETKDISPPQSPPVKGAIRLEVVPFVDPAFAAGAAEAAGIDADMYLNEMQSTEGSGVGQTEQGTTQKDGEGSPAANELEKRSTKQHENPSNCGNDAVGRLTQVLTDFIAFTNGLESSLGAFVDPLANKIIDMDVQIKKIVRTAQSVIKGVMNNIRDGVIGKLTVLFSQFLGNLNLINPLDFITDEASKKAFQAIIDQIFCIFEKLIQDLFDFLVNLFRGLVESVVNGPICAAEQFVSGIFAKVYDMLEDLMGPVLDGLEWLTGGIGSIQGFLRQASNLASQIFSFIGCDGRKCTKPSKWVSTANGALFTAADDWSKQVDNINLLDGVAEDLAEFGKQAEEGIGDFFGSDEFIDQEYNGMRIGDILSATDALTGGDSAGALDRGLGSIESAISTTSLFGTNTIFDACNQKINNPISQDDIIPMPIGYSYDKCIPPAIKISGSGSGAAATPIVNSQQRVIAVRIDNPGTGYDGNTAAVLIDNTNHGRGGQLKVIVEEGRIKNIAVLDGGKGYCPNTAPITDNPVGIVTDIYIDTPGIGYTPGDSILIPLPRIDDDVDLDRDFDRDGDNDDLPVVIVEPIVSPGNGSIIGVRLPSDINDEFNFTPNIVINTRTGRGANLIPVLAYKQTESTDPLAGVKRSTLVGITSVIDCI